MSEKIYCEKEKKEVEIFPCYENGKINLSGVGKVEHEGPKALYTWNVNDDRRIPDFSEECVKCIICKSEKNFRRKYAEEVVKDMNYTMNIEKLKKCEETGKPVDPVEETSEEDTKKLKESTEGEIAIKIDKETLRRIEMNGYRVHKIGNCFC